jgi:hypothetical protein
MFEAPAWRPTIWSFLMIRVVSFIAAAVCASPLAAQEIGNFFEAGASTYNITISDDASGIRSTGPGAFARGRLFVENNWFIQGDVQAAFTDGSEMGSDFDFDTQFYRLGIGAANAIGDGAAMAAVWAEAIHNRVRIKESGGSSDSESETGFGVHLRIDRLNDLARFIPYAQAGYVSIEDFSGPEAKVGIAVNLGPVSPFLEYQYLRIKDDDRLTVRAAHLGVRFRF